MATRVEFISAGFAEILRSEGTHAALASQGAGIRSHVTACQTHQRSVRGRSDGRWLEIVGCDPKTTVEAYESKKQMRGAAVMLASADTTFFVVSVYFGSLGIKNLRHTIPAALCADAAAFIAAAAAVRIFM